MRVIQVTRFGGPQVDTTIRAGRAVGFFPHRPPYVPGNGVGGQVISVGSGLDSGWLGQQVIAHPAVRRRRRLRRASHSPTPRDAIAKTLLLAD